MKKHIKLILTICFAFCMTLCLGLAVACQNTPQENKFTVTVVNENDAAVVGQFVNFCADGANGQCTPKQTDANGKAVIDLNETLWKNASSLHIACVNYEYGLAPYGEDDLCYPDGLTVDHKKVKSYKFTLKLTPIPVTAGVENDVRSLKENKPVMYSTQVEKNTTAIFTSNVYNGTFEFSATVGNSTTPVTATLDSAHPNASITATGTSIDRMVPITITLTPKTAASTHIAFRLVTVYELGSTLSVSNSSLDGSADYSAFYNLTEASTTLKFSTITGDLADAAGGYPITLKVGNANPVTWNSSADITDITTTETGNVAFIFHFGDADTAFLGLTVDSEGAKEEAAGTYENPYVATSGTPFEVSIKADTYMYYVTFTATAAGTVTISTTSVNAYLSGNVDGAYFDSITATASGITKDIAMKAGEVLTLEFSSYDPANPNNLEFVVDYTATLTFNAQ